MVVNEFQSTPPRRRRRILMVNGGIMILFQSTPPRRRRQVQGITGTNPKNFNPRLREGGDLGQGNSVPSTLIFQSTPPRRRRPRIRQYLGVSSLISIHASAKEATATYCNTPAIMCISSFNNFFVHHF